MEIIGHKTQALLDLWSFCHFFTGIAIGNLTTRVFDDRVKDPSNCPGHKNVLFSLIAILILAYAWEFFELALESGYAGPSVSYWFQGQEHWLNRLVSDPLLVLIGYAVGYRFQRLIWPARVILLAWLWMFVFILPNSMAYLQ